MNAQEAEKKLGEIQSRWGKCRSCVLHESSEGVVTAAMYTAPDLSGRGGAWALVIGEIPSKKADDEGNLLAGKYGAIVEDMLLAAGIRRAIVTTVVACRPSRAATPKPDQIQACNPRLVELVDAVKPAAVICLGKVASKVVDAGLKKGRRNLVKRISRATVVDPAVWISKKLPLDELEEQKEKVVAKLLRLAKRAKLDVDVVHEGVGECAHDFTEVGAWTGTPRHEDVISVCRNCTEIAA